MTLKMRQASSQTDIVLSMMQKDLAPVGDERTARDTQLEDHGERKR